jgi:CheY-like chemotaxis protein
VNRTSTASQAGYGRSSLGLSEEADAGEARRTEPLTILVVDDEQDSRSFLRAGLTGVGFDFLEAASGEQALSVLDIRRPDLLIVDVMMPGMTGFELCARIRLRDDMRDLPIILYSAFPMRHSNAGLYQRAFVKPADLEELLHAVRSLLPDPA